MAPLLIMGLGNYGQMLKSHSISRSFALTSYDDTRHNIGARALVSLASRWDVRLKVEPKLGVMIGTRVGVQKQILIRSLGFMNLSGIVLKKVMSEFEVPVGNLLVLHDDARLKLEEVCLQESGPMRGQNGLRSIFKEIGSDAFSRIRIGIATDSFHPGLEHYQERLGSFVLGKFTPEEESRLPCIFDAVHDLVESYYK